MGLCPKYYDLGFGQGHGLVCLTLRTAGKQFQLRLLCQRLVLIIISWFCSVLFFVF